MKVKMILPALTEATSPFCRPIKYSLFPPLGLATLAGYLGRRRRGRDPGRTCRTAAIWTTRPTWSSFRSTSRRRIAPIAWPITTAAAGRTSRSAVSTSPSLPDEAAPHADTIFLGPGEDTWPAFLADFRRGARPGLSLARSGRSPACRRSAAIYQASSLSRAQLHRRVARLPARVRLLLQGGVLRRRHVVLHADGRCRARRDRSPARPAPLLPRRPSVRRSAALPPRSSTACAAWDGSGRPPPRSTPCCARSARARRRRRPAQPVRRIRDAQPGEPRGAAQVSEPASRLRRRHPPSARSRRDDQRQLRLWHG